jgi:hypothetical protein
MRASCSGDQVEKDSSRRGSTPWQVCSHFDKAPPLSLLLSTMMTPPTLRTLQQMAGYHCLANGDKRVRWIAVLRFVSFAAMPAWQLEKASNILIDPPPCWPSWSDAAPPPSPVPHPRFDRGSRPPRRAASRARARGSGTAGPISATAAWRTGFEGDCRAAGTSAKSWVYRDWMTRPRYASLPFRFSGRSRRAAGAPGRR